MNQDLVSQCVQLVPSLDQCNVLVLHYEPHRYSSIFRSHPILKTKYVIGYSVWEATDLPESYREGIEHVQEIWTCSRYCSAIFKKYHPQVSYVPHVIERNVLSNDIDRANMKRKIGFSPHLIYFLFVGKLGDRRKNTIALLQAFRRIKHRMPRARLVIKADPREPAGAVQDAQVVVLAEDFTESQLNALYELSHAYVSLHHSEGWGMTLSDAIIFGKPIIATGYSGNLEFMNHNNSFLLKFREQMIHPQDCFGFFDGSMKWAYPNEEDIDEKLVFVYENLQECLVQEKVVRAKHDARLFSRTPVQNIIRHRLEQIAESWQ